MLTQYFPPETGAPQTRLFELAKGLEKRGWEIEVITALPNYPHGRIQEAYRRKWRVVEKIDGITTIRYWLYASNASKALPRIISMLSFSIMAFCAMPRLWRFRPHYLLVESPPLTLGITGWLMCLLSKPRFIFNISDLWPLTAKELGAISDGRGYRLLERLESFLYRRVFACTGQSDEIVAHIREHGAKQVLLFRNGVDLSRFPLPVETSGMAPYTKEQPLKFVYTGLLGVAQGIEKICQNIDFHALGVEFHIYGAGAGRKSLERYLALNPTRGIYYHGSLISAAIPVLLQGHDAAIISLTRHIPGAVPSKIYEAMAAGLPIFFSGEGEGRRIIEKYAVGWTNHPDDFAQLADNILAFKTSWKENHVVIAQNCRQTARQYFNRETQIENLHVFLQEHL
jgi:glycosyltransferase involved in cell wall biosynthesis